MNARIGLAIVLALTAPLIAQRATLAGRVVGADGDALAGWKVVCVGRTVPAAPEIGLLDRLEAITDERGTFRVQVRTAMSYDVWAIGAARQDGAVPVTEVEHQVGAGSVVELRETEPTRPLMIRLEGAAAWEAAGPLAVRAVLETFVYFAVDASSAEDGSFELPALPGARAGLEVLDARGDALTATSVVLRNEGEGDRATGRRLAVVRIPEPVEIPAIVRDASNGEPIAGAEIRFRTGTQFIGPWSDSLLSRPRFDRWCAVGRTDAEGRAVLRVPARRDPRQAPQHQFWLTASAPGYADQHSGWQSQRPFVDGVALAADAALDEVPFGLSPREPWTTELRDSVGALPSLEVVVEATAMIRSESGWTHLARRFVTETDGAGRLRVPQMPADAYEFEVVAEVTEARLDAWHDDAPRAGPFPTYWTALSGQLEPGATPASMLLGGDRTVALQVLGRDGGPARDARALTAPVRDDLASLPDIPMVVRLDPVGRAALRVSSGAQLLVVLHESGYVAEVIEPGDALTRIARTLQPFDEFTVVVRDADGPVAGARIDVVGGSWSSGGDDADRGGKLIDRVFSDVNQRLLERGRTDADGRATLRFVARKNLGFTIRARIDNRNSERIEFQNRPDSDGIVLRIQ